MIELTVLGSGTGIPSARRGSPGYLVRAPGRTLMVDCGPGSLRQAAAAGVSPGDLDAVLLTHFHPDHVLDLPALLFALWNPAYAGRRPLTIAGPAGTRALVDHWLGGPYGKWLRPATYPLSVEEIGPGDAGVGGFSVTAVPVKHAPESLAYRLRAEASGPVLALSGDTGLCDGAVAAGLGASLYVLECALPDPPAWDGHLTPLGAAEVAARADPRTLVLTHFYPAVEDSPIREIVSRRYRGFLSLAEDLATWVL